MIISLSRTFLCSVLLVASVASYSGFEQDVDINLLPGQLSASVAVELCDTAFKLFEIYRDNKFSLPEYGMEISELEGASDTRKLTAIVGLTFRIVYCARSRCLNEVSVPGLNMRFFSDNTGPRVYISKKAKDEFLKYKDMKEDVARLYGEAKEGSQFEWDDESSLEISENEQTSFISNETDEQLENLLENKRKELQSYLKWNASDSHWQRVGFVACFCFDQEYKSDDVRVCAGKEIERGKADLDKYIRQATRHLQGEIEALDSAGRDTHGIKDKSSLILRQKSKAAWD